MFLWYLSHLNLLSSSWRTRPSEKQKNPLFPREIRRVTMASRLNLTEQEHFWSGQLVAMPTWWKCTTQTTSSRFPSVSPQWKIWFSSVILWQQMYLVQRWSKKPQSSKKDVSFSLARGSFLFIKLFIDIAEMLYLFLLFSIKLIFYHKIS